MPEYTSMLRNQNISPIPTHNSSNAISTSISISNSNSKVSLNSNTDNDNGSISDTLSNLKELAYQYDITKNGRVTIPNVQWAYASQQYSHSYSKFDFQSWKFVDLSLLNNGKLVSGLSLIIINDIHECNIKTFQDYYVLQITVPTNPTSLSPSSLPSSFLFKFKNFKDYTTFLSTTIVWKNLRQSGKLNKWLYNNPKVDLNKPEEDILVSKLNVYAPIPNEIDDIEINTTPINPLYTREDYGWFKVDCHITSHGVLKFFYKNDILLNQIDIKQLFESEIRILHHSILGSSNVLYLGVIEELRKSHNLTSKTSNLEQLDKLLIDFDLRVDLENWFIILKSFTRLEYLGNKFIKDIYLRNERKLSLEIMESQFNDKYKSNSNDESWFYCELIMWDIPWFRSDIVKIDDLLSTFWKELIEIELPMSNNNEIKLLIKKSNNRDTYEIEGDNSDEIIGSCFITLDDLAGEINYLRKIPIYNLRNQVIGDLIVNLDKFENNILSTNKYKSFENILKNFKIEMLISYIEPKCTTKNLESWSTVLLDIYQSLQKEEEYLETLIKYELSDSNILLKNQEQQQILFKYNTIFRGNSILSKSLEKFTLRVGHEYLEKLLGEFIAKIQQEDLNCECDPKIEPESYEENYQNLLTYLEYLWNRIYNSTNDIPSNIKKQWKILRMNVELSVETEMKNNGPDDAKFKDVALNALSSFIFLRFICPAILNPKLYNLSRSHYSGKISRTLILIAKVLMMLSNRSEFQQHKESYLMKLNEDFIKKHGNEVLNYFDKVTLKKMDFSEKLFNMSNTNSNINNEEQNTSYLIDKYLSMDKLIRILTSDEQEGEIREEFNNIMKEDELVKEYQIEGFDDIEDDFLTSMIKEEDETFGNLLSKHEFKMNDIKKAAEKVVRECKSIENILEKNEDPEIYDDKSWKEFIDYIYENISIINGEVVQTNVVDDYGSDKKLPDKFNEIMKVIEQRGAIVKSQPKVIKRAEVPIVELKKEKSPPITEDKKKWFKLFKRKSTVFNK